MYFLFEFLFLYLFAILLLYTTHKWKKQEHSSKLLIEGLIDLVLSQLISFIILKFFWHMSLKHITENLMSEGRIYFIIKHTLVGAFSLVLVIILRKFILATYEIKTREKKHTKNIVFSSILVSLFGLSLMILLYLAYFFPNLRIDQILFTLKTPIKGTSFLVLACFIILILVIPVGIFFINWINLKKGKELYLSISKLKFKAWPHHFKHCKTVLAIFLVLFSLVFYFKLDLETFLKYSGKENTSFYEENYIDPKTVKFKFPAKKKNLILIYLESTEAETSQYAKKNTNLIPELTERANSNISFSHNDSLGGQRQLYGTGFSLACLCCTQLGLPLTIPITVKTIQSPEDLFKLHEYELEKHFFDEAYGLGDLLEDNGYNLSFLMGADAEFGGLGKLLKTHGNFQIKDLHYFRNTGKVPKDYFVWWGIEDQKIIEYSKEELLELSSKDEPFLFSVFLEDTHATGGYAGEDCEEKYSAQIHNVVRAMSKRVDGFLAWIEEQDFYEDSVIVVLGDHLYMGGDLYENKKVERHAYNCFINTGKSAENTKNRDFATFDYFPTIVESMGITFDAKGLGLGRSLFSGEKTLLEEHGEEKITEDLISKSAYYRRLLLNK